MRRMLKLGLVIVLFTVLGPGIFPPAADADIAVPTYTSVPEEALDDFPASPSSTQAADAGSHQQETGERSALSQLMSKYPDTFRTRGPREKRIALTFDDVPDPRYTGIVLDVLKEHQVKATFFVVGNRAKKHPDLLRRMVEEGHAIGNHSYNHAQFSKLRLPEFIKQIERTNNILEAITGVRPTLIRPPYGDINEEQLQWARKHGYKVVNWNVDSLDWKGLGKDEVKQNVLGAVGPGAIVLQHAGGGAGTDLSGTIEALPEIITELRQQGYSFATVPDMLGVPRNRINKTAK